MASKGDLRCYTAGQVLEHLSGHSIVDLAAIRAEPAAELLLACGAPHERCSLRPEWHPGLMSFRPGDHLRDHRRRFVVPYTHHAIKVHDEQVIEFGGSTANKAAMGIACAPYERFATGRKVHVVCHDGHDAELSIRRAEWLLSCPPTRRYNGIGFNCEHVARWCATGWETESLQIRHRIFGGKYLFIGLPLMFWLAWAQRTNQRLPNWAWLIVGANIAATFVTQYHYHGEIRRFNEHIRANCPRELRANATSG